MSQQNVNSRINLLDFGVSLTRELDKNSKHEKIDKLKLDFSYKSSLKFISLAKALIKKLFKLILNSINKLNWVLSRSIFLGRGFYFKYISSFALLVIVSFGSFVYLRYDKEQNGFISRYAGVSASSSGVIFNPGGQTLIVQKQLKVTQYIVQPGDTLSSIAAKYSTDDNVITVDSIMWANGLKPGDILRPGDKLDIPPVSGVLHTVKKGDTVLDIAKKYKLINDKSSPEEITGATQRIADMNLLDIKVVKTDNGETRIPEIVEGQRILVPGGIIEPEAPKLAVVKNTNALTASSASRLPQQIVITGQPFIWPVENGIGVITQYYHSRHKAIDIADSRSPLLLAMADGYVKFWGYGGSMCAIGIEIVYDNGYSSLYCHMWSVDPAIKKDLRSTTVRVTQGQVVGRMGNTGYSTGIHLHLEIKKNGVPVNPCSLEPFRSRCYR